MVPTEENCARLDKSEQMILEASSQHLHELPVLGRAAGDTEARPGGLDLVAHCGVAS